ncbi:MAG: Nif3-like dinuclear metal center hexameric protein [Chloroflexi bacterium]|nr:Nif3-like dinuclear metal center hexameric protein [Chloroflexota bacterium]
MAGQPTLDLAAALIEAFAPASLAEPWDNAGWQIRLDTHLSGVMVALDPAPEVVGEARATGCNLLVTHHPLFFRSPASLLAGDLVADSALAAIQAGISIYAAHTNLDSTVGGTSWSLAARLGLEGEAPLVPRPDGATGLGLLARAPRPLRLVHWADEVRRRLESPTALVSGAGQAYHERLAIMGGSGGSAIGAAIDAGATLYVTADITYHQAQAARAGGLSLVVVDHHASERPVLDIVADLLRQALPCAVTLSRTRTTPWEADRP